MIDEYEGELQNFAQLTGMRIIEASTSIAEFLSAKLEHPDERDGVRARFTLHRHWRIESADCVFAGCDDSHERIVDSLRLLTGAIILETRCTRPGYGLEIALDNGIEIVWFASAADKVDRPEGYGPAWYALLEYDHESRRPDGNGAKSHDEPAFPFLRFEDQRDVADRYSELIARTHQVIGLFCLRARLANPGGNTLVLDFAETTSDLAAPTLVWIAAMAHYRFESSEVVFGGDEDDIEYLGQQIGRFVGRAVTGFIGSRPSYDATIQFDGDLSLKLMVGGAEGYLESTGTSTSWKCAGRLFSTRTDDNGNTGDHVIPQK